MPKSASKRKGSEVDPAVMGLVWAYLRHAMAMPAIAVILWIRRRLAH